MCMATGLSASCSLAKEPFSFACERGDVAGAVFNGARLISNEPYMEACAS